MAGSVTAAGSAVVGSAVVGRVVVVRGAAVATVMTASVSNNETNKRFIFEANGSSLRLRIYLRT